MRQRAAALRSRARAPIRRDPHATRLARRAATATHAHAATRVGQERGDARVARWTAGPSRQQCQHPRPSARARPGEVVKGTPRSSAAPPINSRGTDAADAPKRTARVRARRARCPPRPRSAAAVKCARHFRGPEAAENREKCRNQARREGDFSRKRRCMLTSKLVAGCNKLALGCRKTDTPIPPEVGSQGRPKVYPDPP